MRSRTKFFTKISNRININRITIFILKQSYCPTFFGIFISHNFLNNWQIF